MERELIELPIRMASLPRDERGYPVPRFVEWIDGKPDFRVIDGRHMAACVSSDLCWLCGQKLGAYKAFVIGPMCAINRINSEPPSHYVCARFAVRNCPFLTRPLATRNKRDLPADGEQPAGISIDRNPGCCAIWVAKSYTPFSPHAGGPGVLFRMGEPQRVEFWAHGNIATRSEVERSVHGGLPFLEEMARQDGPQAQRALREQVDQFYRMLDNALPSRSGREA